MTATKTKKKTAKSSSATPIFGGRKWTPPATQTYQVKDANKEITITVKFGVGKIKSKVSCFGTVVRKNGKPLTVDVNVPTTTISCKVKDVENPRAKRLNETVLEARSCCKPPDIFDIKTGIHYAVKRLFKVDDPSPRLDTENRAAIMQAVCPWIFKKKS